MAKMKSMGNARSDAERIASVIFEYAAKISGETEISALIQLNADLARDLVGAERCSLWLLDHDAGELWTKVAHGTEEIRIPAGEGIVGACVTQNEAVLVNDVTSNEHFFDGIDQARVYRTQSIACMPLRAENKVIGALQLLNKTGGFSDGDTELLRFLAVYVAAAIQAERLRQQAESARLLRREIEVASEVQRKLFPQHLGDVPGLEYFGICRPARIMSGDYYDFQNLPDGSFGLSLGDVSGKGFPAAVLMASIQTLLRSLLGGNSTGPAKVITDLNAAVHSICVPERYSTLFCGVLSPQRDRLTYVNAGHVAPLIVRLSDGEITRPQEGDLPVGLFGSVIYHQHQVSVAPGDLIVCVSDGVFDVQNAQGELWDDIPVEQILSSNRSTPVEMIAKALMQAIDSYSMGAEQFDDITITIVRLKRNAS